MSATLVIPNLIAAGRPTCRAGSLSLIAVICIVSSPYAWTQTPDKLLLSNDEQAVVDMTNAERAKQKLPALKPNPVLFRVAREHSANMAKKGELKHELDGKTPGDRFRDAGYSYRQSGENIAFGTRLAPAGAMKFWMQSEGHK